MGKEEVNIRSLRNSMASAWDKNLTVIRLGANPFKFFLSSEDEDVRKPIKRKNIQLKDKGNILMALLRYEQLPSIC